MRLLTEISDETLGIGKSEQLNTPYIMRKSARAVLFNEVGEVALQHLSVPGYHKLPGGGIDQGETVEEALRREVKEEVGCDCEIIDEVGIIIEYRNEDNLLHISYCYTARVVGSIGEPKYEGGEIEEGQSTVWVLPEEGVRLANEGKPDSYNGKFIVRRDGLFIKTAISS